MIQRPKPGETEEDLLRQQKEFLKASGGRSRLKKSSEENKNTNQFEILKDVVERREPFPTSKGSKPQESEGFPKTFVVNPSVAKKKGRGKKKKSLFLMQMEEKKHTSTEETEVVEAENSSPSSLPAANVEAENSSPSSLTAANVEAENSSPSSLTAANVEAEKSSPSSLPVANVEAENSSPSSLPAANVEAENSSPSSLTAANVEAENSSPSSLPVANVEAENSSPSSLPAANVEAEKSSPSSLTAANVEAENSSPSSLTAANVEAENSSPSSLPAANVESKNSSPSSLPAANIEAENNSPSSLTAANVEAENSSPSSLTAANVEVENSSPSSLPAANVESKNSSPSSLPAANIEAENNSPSSLPAANVEAVDSSFIEWSTTQEKPSVAVSDSLRGVHDENLEKLSKMSEEEILEERNKLLENLNPDVIAFLKSRKSKKGCLLSEEPKKVENLSSLFEDEEVKKKLSKYIDSQWLNMDFIEKEKLEWIGDLPDKKALEPNQPYSARFDFKGNLQPYDDKIDVRNALYHHGEEPNRPGYTIEELYQLSRSNVLQQRILALDTLANIIRKTKLGYYDRCFDGQLLHKLVESDLFFLLRFSIDEKPLIASSINCLHSLLCNESDEFCLDKLLGVTNADKQPFLFNKMETKEDEEKELKDHVIIGCDMIKGVLRTDLLIRMAYVLKYFAQSWETDVKAIDCLIRIARHSLDATFQILNTGHLLDVVYCNLKTRRPAYQGVKLLRIMSTQSGEVAALLSRRFSIKFLISFLEKDENHNISKKDFYLLKLETIYFWRTLLNHNLCVDVFLEWLPCLRRLLLFYVEKIDFNTENEFDFELFSALTSLLITCNKKKITSDSNIDEMMKICLEKWLTQLMRLGDYNFATCKALGCLLRYFTTYYKAFGVTALDLEFIKKTSKLFMTLYGTEVFEKMADMLTDYSYILTSSVVTRDPDNLPSLCAVYDGGEDFLRIVNTSSSLPLFISLVKYLKACYRVSVETMPAISQLFESPQLRKYIIRIYKCTSKDYNWFLKYEFDFLLGCLYLLAILDNQESINLSFRLFPMTRVDDKRASKILQVMCDLSIWKLKLEEDILRNFYDYCLNFLIEERSETEQLNYKSDLIPEEWPYKLLSTLRGHKNVAVVASVLKLISFVLSINPMLFSRISYTLRYYYLCIVFLTDENVSDPIVQTLLEEVFENILHYRFKINLNLKYEGNKSFYDLYTELVIQYGALSYGLEIFGKFILFPLQNRFNVSYRKLMWFEYMHVLRVIIAPYPFYTFMRMRDFVLPVETDESLLVCYLNSLSNNVITKGRNSFVYTMAVGNVHSFLNSKGQCHKLSSFLKKKVRSLKCHVLKKDIKEFILD